MRKSLKLILSLSLILLNAAEVFAQCAQCKAAAGSRDAAGNLIIGGGINAGVLYLLSLPFLLILIVGGVFYWRSRKMRFNKEA
ncbi:MAG: hypothetical protein SF052_27555 [Bacteroidia bacterium]|nr:hypothetical protein [Bacteroidia bacterium]